MRGFAVAVSILLMGCAEDRLTQVANPPLPPKVETPTTCQTGVLTGRVCMPGDDEALVGAQVSIQAADCNGTTDTYSATTGNDGSFSLPGLPEGNHLVTVQKGGTTLSFHATIEGGEITVAASDDANAPLCGTPAPPRVAVITGDWDEVQVLLADLEIPYEIFESGDGFFEASEAAVFLEDLSAMQAFDVIFFNCGNFGRDFLGAYDDWFSADVTFDYTSDVFANLRTFVQQGGSLYASDWAWPMVEGVRANAVDFYGDETNGYNVIAGVEGEMQTEVTNAGLQAFLGTNQLHVSMDLENWAVIQAAGSGTDTYVKGDVSIYTDLYGSETEEIGTKPLVVGFTPFSGGGRVLYTTFHYHSQSESDMLDVLRYLILEL